MIKDYMDIEEAFSYHAPKDDQPARYAALREGAKYFARTILDNAPQSADRTYALRLVRIALMVANGSIATDGQF